MIDQSKIAELNKIAKQMVAPGKGILAADESTGTIGKRFEKISLPNEEANRQAYREILFTAPDIGKYISGVILYDETLRQRARPSSGLTATFPQGGKEIRNNASDGRTFVSILEAAGVLPGIKVDLGTENFGESPDEKITKGLDGLPKRLAEYVALGAKFAKWRAVITIGKDLPTKANIRQNAKTLAGYALVCQEAGLVPIVEPEVLMDGSHSMERCEEVSEKTLTYVFEELQAAKVAPEGIILKTNMAVPGKDSGEKLSPQQIAQATLRVFKKVLPNGLPGQAFLSGGQSEIEATENLNAMHLLGKLPWQLSFSYGRALQDSALKIWKGKPENVKAAQAAFIHRAKMNGLATLGKYSSEMEKGV
jgi:fructose-bisphosphate aldolase class I